MAVPAEPACDRAADADLPNESDSVGSDANNGSASPYQPVLTASRLLEVLGPGDVGCLRSGNYSEISNSIRDAEATLTSWPDEQATLRGRLRIEDTATGAVVENLVLNGRQLGGGTAAPVR